MEQIFTSFVRVFKGYLMSLKRPRKMKKERSTRTSQFTLDKTTADKITLQTGETNTRRNNPIKSNANR